MILSSTSFIPSSSIQNIPAIIGGSIGGFLFLLIIGAILFGIIKKRTQPRNSNQNPYYDKTYKEQDLQVKSSIYDSNICFPEETNQKETALNKIDGYAYLYSDVIKSRQDNINSNSEEANSNIQHVELEILDENEKPVLIEEHSATNENNSGIDAKQSSKINRHTYPITN